METPTESPAPWSALDTMIWIASRSEEVVNRHFRSFGEAASNFSALGVWGPQVSHSFERIRNIEFLPALDAGFPHTAIEAELLCTDGGYLIVPKRLERVTCSGRRQGEGKWFVTSPNRRISTLKGTERTSNSPDGERNPGRACFTNECEQTLALEWRPKSPEAAAATEYWLDADFNKIDVISLWPRHLEDEAWRQASKPALDVPLRFGRKLPAWAAYGDFIPFKEVLEFGAFGRPLEESAQTGEANAELGGTDNRLRDRIAIFHTSQFSFSAGRDKALFFHARSIQAGGAMGASIEPIAAANFLVRMRLATNSRSDIARDRGCPGDVYVPPDFTDVFVERAGLAKWFETVPSGLKTRASAKAVGQCKAWLLNLRAAGPLPLPKNAYERRAKLEFKLGRGKFDDAWRQANKDTAPKTLRNRGRPPQARETAP